MSTASASSNQSLAPAYLLPFLVYVGIASIPTHWGLPLTANYALRLVATTAVLAWGWRRYVSLRGPRSALGSIALGALAGLAGTAVWIALKAPFYPGGGEPWTRDAYLLRLVASGTVVALFEELLFRGYLLRLVVQWERARRRGARDAFGEAFERSTVNSLEPGAWTPLALVVSTAAFAAGHQPGEYAAAFVYGLLMAGLWMTRKDLISCVVAHGVTNVTLAFVVALSGDWARW